MNRTAFFALMFLLILGAGMGPAAAASPPAAEVATADVRVMSFNLRYGLAADGDDAWEHRHDLVFDAIAAFSPDLLGVQECLDFQGAFLRANLPDHDFVGAGRDDGNSGGEMCAVFFRRDRFELVDSGHFWLSETPEVVASRAWDAALTRMATWVILRTRDQRPETFLYLNTHFDHVGETARRESAKVIRAQLAIIAPDLPVIVTGDFNAAADAALDGPYRVLTADGALIDTYRALHEAAPGEGTFNSFRGESDGDRIDWILCTSDWVVREAGIVRSERRGRYPSDHFPVTAELSFPAEH